MLEMVLIQKGVMTDTTHYQLDPNTVAAPLRRMQGGESVSSTQPQALDESEGVHL